MTRVIVSLAMSLDGFIAGPNDAGDNPLGDGGMRLFDWYFNGDTPSRYYQATAGRGVAVPPFKLSPTSAHVFDELIESCGALGGGVRLFDYVGTGTVELETMCVVEAPGVTHLRYRVLKGPTH